MIFRSDVNEICYAGFAHAFPGFSGTIDLTADASASVLTILTPVRATFAGLLFLSNVFRQMQV